METPTKNSFKNKKTKRNKQHKFKRLVAFAIEFFSTWAIWLSLSFFVDKINSQKSIKILAIFEKPIIIKAVLTKIQKILRKENDDYGSSK